MPDSSIKYVMLWNTSNWSQILNLSNSVIETSIRSDRLWFMSQYIDDPCCLFLLHLKVACMPDKPRIWRSSRSSKTSTSSSYKPRPMECRSISDLKWYFSSTRKLPGVCFTCPCFPLFTSIGTFIKAKFSVTDEFFFFIYFSRGNGCCLYDRAWEAWFDQ